MTGGRLITLCMAAVSAAVTCAATSSQAAILDLTTVGAKRQANGAQFWQFDPTHATGTGLIESFLRVQNHPTERGYNTDGKTEFDEKGGNFTHSVKVSEVPTVRLGGVTYWEFLLDIGEGGGPDRLVSLDELKIYVENRGDLVGYPGVFTTQAYDLAAGNWIKLDGSLDSGNGGGDMIALIPVGQHGADPNKYLYLYCKFGPNLPADSSFEEWAHGIGGPIIPEPATLSVVLIGALAAVCRRRT